MADSSREDAIGTMLEPGERPTLRTISRITGLAVATVSRALHDAPDLSRDTKKRVRETADAIGYRPNRAGVRLRTGKTNVVSLVMSTEHDLMNHTAQLLSSIAEGLRGTPFHLVVTPYFPDEDPLTPIRYIVETQSADAVILNQTEPQDVRLKFLMEKRFPFATHGRSDWSEQHAYFDFDNARFSEIAIEEFARRGRKSVLLIAPPSVHSYSQHMAKGAREAAKLQGLALHELDGATSHSASNDIEKAVDAHLTAHPETDAVISASTMATLALSSVIERRGMKIGREIDVFIKEAVPFLSRFQTDVLTVREDVAQAGEFLARAVLKQLSDPSAPPMQGLDVPVFST